MVTIRWQYTQIAHTNGAILSARSGKTTCYASNAAFDTFSHLPLAIELSVSLPDTNRYSRHSMVIRMRGEGKPTNTIWSHSRERGRSHQG